jgi:hypothetical protein
MKNSESEETKLLPRTSAGNPPYPGEQENVPAKDETPVPDRALPPVQDRANATAVQDRATPTVQAQEDATVLATANTSTELRDEDEDVLEWFARSIAKPSNAELGEMLRWTQKTIVQEGVTEHHLQWLTKVRPILNKLDTMSVVNPLKVKRTMLLLITADYFNKPRQKVFELPGTAGRTAYERWMRKPELAAIYNEIYALMESEVIEHELAEIRKATRITRTSAGRAAEVRASLLEHPNPWVALQSARDIMQSADRQTAAKGSTHTNLNVQLTAHQVDQLLDRAGSKLQSWDELAEADYDHDRPVVILDQQPEQEEELDQTAVPPTPE